MPTVITIAGYNHGILTADEFVEQGTAPGAIMSIAAHLSASGHDHVPQPLLAAEVRSVAREIASITGQSLAVPGAVNDARVLARRPHNDNRKRAARKNYRGAA